MVERVLVAVPVECISSRTTFTFALKLTTYHERFGHTQMERHEMKAPT